MKSIEKVVAENVSDLRQKRGWTQENLAEAAGMSLTGIQRLEAAERFPRPASLEGLAKAFKVKVWELFVAADDQSFVKGQNKPVGSIDGVQNGNTKDRSRDGAVKFGNAGNVGSGPAEHPAENHGARKDETLKHDLASEVAAKVVTALRSDSTFSPDKQRLVALIRDLPDSRVRTLIDVLSGETAAVAGDKEDAGG